MGGWGRGPQGSLSVRRAWIEITDDVSTGGKIKESLSVRRAWIEIILLPALCTFLAVALRKESVDRNIFWPVYLMLLLRRSP